MPPVIIPMNRDEYTSLVISARPIATIGGSSDHIEPTASEIGDCIKQPMTYASMNTAKIILLICFFKIKLPLQLNKVVQKVYHKSTIITTIL